MSLASIRIRVVKQIRDVCFCIRYTAKGLASFGVQRMVSATHFIGEAFVLGLTKRQPLASAQSRDISPESSLSIAMTDVHLHIRRVQTSLPTFSWCLID